MVPLRYGFPVPGRELACREQQRRQRSQPRIDRVGIALESPARAIPATRTQVGLDFKTDERSHGNLLASTRTATPRSSLPAIPGLGDYSATNNRNEGYIDAIIRPSGLFIVSRNICDVPGVEIIDGSWVAEEPHEAGKSGDESAENDTIADAIESGARWRLRIGNGEPHSSSNSPAHLMRLLPLTLMCE